MPFGEVHAGIEEGDGAICGLLWWCCPGGCCTSEEVPGRTNPGNYSWEDPAHPHWRAPKELAPAKVPTEEAAPAEEPIKEAAPAEEPTKEVAPTEEPTEEAPPTEEPTEKVVPVDEPSEEPIAPKATISEPAGEPDIPPVWHEDKGKGEVPHGDFPG